jgi:hypothetical protein
LELLASWTDVMILKIVFDENFGVFWFEIMSVFCKLRIITLFFEEKRQFFAELGRKSQKIMIITLTPGLAVLCH